MRVALVSPYDWSAPGGVNRHVAGLAGELRARGHDATVVAPGAAPDDGAGTFVSLSDRTVGLPFNGASSNVTLNPAATGRLRRALAAGGFDVVHLHEPVALIGHRRPVGLVDVPTVATFHAYSQQRAPHAFAAAVGTRRLFNRLHVRIAVSEPAAWTARRFFGGDYRIIPNGVTPAADGPPRPRPLAPGEPLEVAFVGQAVERKGLPVLLRAFEALRDHVPARLTVVGAEAGDLDPLILDRRGIAVLGRVDDAERSRVLARAHVLCAPSLGGESFGMVLTEAFAAGTPVVASDIAGYRGVVTAGRDAVLVPPGDALGLAETLRDLACDPQRLHAMAVDAASSADRFAWPCVTADVERAYEDAIAVPAPRTARARAAVRLGVRCADGRSPRPPQRLPPPDPRQAPRGLPARRLAVVAAAIATAVAAVVGVQRIGWHSVASAVLASSPAWVLLAVALMCTSMLLRAVSWHAILRAAAPTAHARLVDAVQGTAIGVLMSATLPARLGELSRALVVSRRLGRPRQLVATVLGTLVTQTVLNVAALMLLGVVVVSRTGLIGDRHLTLLVYALGPLVLIGAVVVAPALLRPAGRSQLARGLVSAVTQVRAGLGVFRRPRRAAVASAAQLSAWALQWLACVTVFAAVGIHPGGAAAAAASVLFAVNVTAAVPVTPSNIGLFQAACVAVLTSGYHVRPAQALGYGIVLQAVELATAIVVGMPALMREGVTWREVRLRALHSAPITLGTGPAGAAADARRAQ